MWSSVSTGKTQEAWRAAPSAKKANRACLREAWRAAPSAKSQPSLLTGGVEGAALRNPPNSALVTPDSDIGVAYRLYANK